MPAGFSANSDCTKRSASDVPPTCRKSTSAFSPYFCRCHSEKARPNSTRIASRWGVMMMTRCAAGAALSDQDKPMTTINESLITIPRQQEKLQELQDRADHGRHVGQ